MLLDRLMNQGNLPLLEQSMRFASARHTVLAENVANLSTPGYRQKDLDAGAFQKALVAKVEERRGAPISSARFEGLSNQDIFEPSRGILFHDGNNRTAEQLMTDMSKNALTHNLYGELLKKQFESIKSALRERVS